MALRDDPYVSLEDVDGEEALDFVVQANQACLKALGDPTKSTSRSYSRILKVLESDDRIPFVSKMGRDAKGNDLLYNLWKDSKVSLLFHIGRIVLLQQAQFPCTPSSIPRECFEFGRAH